MDMPLARFNSSWSDKCYVHQMGRAEAADMISAHYLGKWPGVVVLTLGLYHDHRAVGVAVFALPPRETSKRYGGDVWELARLWVDDKMPRNTETWFVAQCIKHVKKTRSDLVGLVSYADPSAGHTGVIYKAGNWESDGKTDDDRKTARFDYAHPDTGKKYSRRSHVPSGVTPVRIPRVSKFRYFYRLGPKLTKGRTVKDFVEAGE